MDLGEPVKKKRRKGGLEQRMQSAQDDLQTESALHSQLMALLALGMLSGMIVRSLAEAAVKDLQSASAGCAFPTVERLGKIAQGRNLIRTVYDHLAKACPLPHPFKVEMPFTDGSFMQSILLPHEWFSAMYDMKQAWRTCILQDDSKLAHFWEVFGKHPCMLGHPVKKTKDFQSWAIPISMHGDEVPVVGVGKIWSRSALSFSWCSLINNALGAKGDDIMIYLWAVFEKFCVPAQRTRLGTMDCFWQILKWSFGAMYLGVWPSKDWRGQRFDPNSPQGQKAGKQLGGGYIGVLLQLCGDLDYFQKWIGLPVSTTHARPCGLCRATFAGPTSWMDNRPNSPWQATMLSTGNWKEHWNSSCALFDLPGMTGLCLAMDLMHNLFLGWLQYVYGSVMYLLTHECLDQAPLADLKTVWVFLKDTQKSFGTKYKYKQRLDKLSMFTRASDFPKLKGRAADIMGLAHALHLCWNQFMSHGITRHVQISALLELNLDIANLLDAYSPKFGFMAVPEDTCKVLVAKACQMAQLHVQLCEFYKGQGQSLFNMTSKTHFVIHSLQLSRYIHPSLVWCFKGEVNMKKTQKVFKSCLAGNKHWAVGNAAALKFRHLLHIKFNMLDH